MIKSQEEKLQMISVLVKALKGQNLTEQEIEFLSENGKQDALEKYYERRGKKLERNNKNDMIKHKEPEELFDFPVEEHFNDGTGYPHEVHVKELPSDFANKPIMIVEKNKIYTLFRSISSSVASDFSEKLGNGDILFKTKRGDCDVFARRNKEYIKSLENTGAIYQFVRMSLREVVELAKNAPEKYDMDAWHKPIVKQQREAETPKPKEDVVIKKPHPTIIATQKPKEEADDNFPPLSISWVRPREDVLRLKKERKDREAIEGKPKRTKVFNISSAFHLKSEATKSKQQEVATEPKQDFFLPEPQKPNIDTTPNVAQKAKPQLVVDEKLMIPETEDLKNNLKEQRWVKNYNGLLQFIKEYNRFPQNGEMFGYWSTVQRQNYQVGAMSQDHIDRLNAIGFSWEEKGKVRKQVVSVEKTETSSNPIEVSSSHSLISIAQKLTDHLEAHRAELRTNQVRAFEKLIAFIEAGKTQGLIKQPTGAGKTRLFGEILAAIRRPSLVLVPRENLLSQTFDQLVGDPKRDIDGVGFTAEEVLVIKTEKKRAINYIEKIITKIDKNILCIVMTYQAFVSVARENKKLLDIFMSHIETIVFDEAHRSLGEKTKQTVQEYSEEEDQGREAEIISKRFKVLRLFFTATPRLSEKNVYKEYNIDIIDSLTISELQKDGTLIRPTIVGKEEIGIANFLLKDGVSFSSLTDSYIEQIAERSGGKGFTMENGKSVMDTVAEKYIELKKVNKNYLPSVAFCPNIKQAEEFALYLNQCGVRAVRCTSANKTMNRGVKVKDLQEMFHNNQVDVVTTVSKISEGFDVPTLRCSMWLMPTASMARFIQANGRIMRTLPNNSIHPKKDSHNTYLICPGWKGCRSSAISINEQAINDNQEEDILQNFGRKSKKLDPKKRARGFVFPNFYEIMAMAGEYTEKDLENAGVKCRAEFKEDGIWREKFEKVKKIKEIRGRTPTAYEFLGRWCAHQRDNYRKNKLLEHHRVLLDSIGFIWEPVKIQNKEEKWGERYLELAEYINKNGVLPPNKTPLGRWCYEQKRMYKLSNLGDEKIEKLKKIGLDFNSSFSSKKNNDQLIENYTDLINDDIWMENYTKLVEYIKKMKKFPNHTDNNPLSFWCTNQRKLFQNDTLSQEKIKLLTAIKFKFSKYHHKHWSMNYGKLVSFIEKEKRFPSITEPLGVWCEQQRRAYQEEALTISQVKFLEEIGFEWGDNWHKQFEALKALKEKEWRLPTPDDPLWAWVQQQRVHYKENSLATDRRKKLDAINFLW